MNQGKKNRLIEATIAIAAEEGLNGLSMKQVVRRAQTSETLIYQHFENKEGLYYACFNVINEELKSFLDNYPDETGENRDEVYEFVHKLWLDFFRFLVEHKERTYFYYSYRNSAYINPYREAAAENSAKYLKKFDEIYQKINVDSGINLTVDRNCLWSYVLDTTYTFAHHVIQGEIQDTPETCEHMWMLLSHGLFSSK